MSRTERFGFKRSRAITANPPFLASELETANSSYIKIGELVNDCGFFTHTPWKVLYISLF